MESEWIQVRLRRETAEKLRAFGRRILKLVNAGRTELILPRQGEVSIDALVAVLLARDDKAQERNRKQTDKRYRRPEQSPEEGVDQ